MGKSLRKYINRFGKISINIQNLSPDVAMHHMVTSLRPESFADDGQEGKTLQKGKAEGVAERSSTSSLGDLLGVEAPTTLERNT